MTTTAEDLLAQARRRIPQAVELARPISLCVRAEPSLLRTLRLAKRLDASAEADLWFSDLVATAGPLGVALRPAVADALRAELDDGERDATWDLVLRHHGGAPWSIRLEEQINYLHAGGVTDADADELVTAALAELREKQQNAPKEAIGIARWLLTALGRLPQSARSSPTAAAAAVLAGAQLDGRLAGLDELSADDREAWLPWLMRGIGTAPVSLRWMPGALVIGDDGPGSVAVDVPATEPVVLTAEYHHGPERRSQEVRIRRGERHAVPAEPKLITLRTVRGDEIGVEPSGLGFLQDADGKYAGPAFAIAPDRIVTAVIDEGPMLFVPVTGPAIECRPGRPAGARLGTYRLSRPAPHVVRVGAASPGDRWRLADGRAGGGRVVGVEGGELLLDTDSRFEYEAGLAITLERPWGTICGALVEPLRAVVVDERFGLDPEQVREEPDGADAETDAEEIFALPLFNGTLPRLHGIGPEQLGISLEGPLGERYVPRSVDQRLADAIHDQDIVVLVGPPGSGLRRTLWEAVTRWAPRAALAVPVGAPGALTRLLDHPAMRDAHGTVVLWLDPVAAFLPDLQDAAPGLLDPELSADLCVIVPLEEKDAGRVLPLLERAQGPLSRVSTHKLSRSLNPVELKDARGIMPDLELDPEDPWRGSELEARQRRLELMRATGDRDRLADALHDHSRFLAAAGRLVEARDAAEEGLAVLRQVMAGLHDVAVRSRLADRMEEAAGLYGVTGDRDRALELAVEAVELWREDAIADDHGQRLRLAWSLLSLAARLGEVDRLDEAIKATEEAISIFTSRVWQDPSARTGRSHALQAQSVYLARAGRSDEAIRLATEAVTDERERPPSDPDRQVAAALLNLAERQRDAGAVETARESAAVAVDELRRRAEPMALAGGLLVLGRIERDAARHARAVQLVEEAISLLRPRLEHGTPSERTELANPLLELSRLQLALGNAGAALAPALESAELWRALPVGTQSREYWLSSALETAAEVFQRLGRLDEAIAVDDEHVALVEAAPPELREAVLQRAAERRALAGPRAKAPAQQETVRAWAASWDGRGGSVEVHADHLVVRNDVEELQLQLRNIVSIEVLNRASIRRPPTARLHRPDRGSLDIGILASRLSPNFRPANNKAFDEFLDALPASIPRSDGDVEETSAMRPAQ